MELVCYRWQVHSIYRVRIPSEYHFKDNTLEKRNDSSVRPDIPGGLGHPFQVSSERIRGGVPPHRRRVLLDPDIVEVQGGGD